MAAPRTVEAWPLPPYHPAASGDLLILAGDLGVVALRCHDGEPAWSLPPGDGGLATESGLSGAAVAGGLVLARQGQVNLGVQYALPGMAPAGESGLVALEALSGKSRCPAGRIEAPPAVRQDAPAEPKPAEEAPEAAEGNAPAAARPAAGAERTVFTGVPALARGLAVSAALRRSAQPEYELTAFDPAGGGLRWRTYLCGGRPVRAAAQNNWGGMPGQALTEIGQPPAAAGRSLYAVTNLGALAAVDAEDGAVRWLRLYPRYSPPEAAAKAAARAGAFAFGAGPAIDRNALDMWESCAPVLAGTLLLAAPQDSDHLMALDQETGRLVWRAPDSGACSGRSTGASCSPASTRWWCAARPTGGRSGAGRWAPGWSATGRSAGATSRSAPPRPWR
jgi:outer membrane protein assembly factor BamB